MVYYMLIITVYTPYNPTASVLFLFLMRIFCILTVSTPPPFNSPGYSVRGPYTSEYRIENLSPGTGVVKRVDEDQGQGAGHTAGGDVCGELVIPGSVLPRLGTGIS
jgi:hypothetical protein